MIGSSRCARRSARDLRAQAALRVAVRDHAGPEQDLVRGWRAAAGRRCAPEVTLSPGWSCGWMALGPDSDDRVSVASLPHVFLLLTAINYMGVRF